MVIFAFAGVSSEQVHLPATGITSPYTEAVFHWIKNWRAPSRLTSSEKYRLRCYNFKGNELYIGVEQTLEISASLANISKVLDDLSLYSKIFDDLLVAEERARKGNQWLVFSEQHIAIPFIPNEKNEMIYWLEKDSPQRRIYRYQLASSNHLRSNDGAIVLESLGSTLTMYSEVDFYDADWGIAKSLGDKRIWKDSIEGLLQSDLAIQMKAEHPDWSNEKVLETSKDQSSQADVDTCFKEKTEFKPQ